MSTEQKVLTHFHADAQRFDAIYEDDKTPVTRFIDHVWRGVVRERLTLATARLGDLTGKRVLDVGCGSGRFCIEYAAHGAAHVLGVDFAPAMIDRAREIATTAGVAERCEFRVGAFPADVPEQGFDASTAMGFFDYIEHPVAMVAAMRERTRGMMLMSFPKAIEWRVPVRRIRFALIGCPLFLYTESHTRRILAEAGVTDYEWIALDRDYVVVAKV